MSIKVWKKQYAMFCPLVSFYCQKKYNIKKKFYVFCKRRQGRYSGSRLDQCTFTLYGGNWRFTLNGLPPWY